MAIIDDPVKAERLARAIAADITLYNEAKIKAATDVRVELQAEIEEGRALFDSRVAPALREIYDRVLNDRWPTSGAPTVSTFPPVAKPAAPVMAAPVTPAPRSKPTFESVFPGEPEAPPASPRGVLWLVAVVGVLAALAAGLWLLRGP